MNTDDEAVPSEDAIAEAMRAALARTVADDPSVPIEWTAVLSRARRVVIVRRVLAGSASAVVVVAATAFAFASTSGNERQGVSVVGPGPTTTTTSVQTTTTSTSTSTLAPPLTSSPSTPPTVAGGHGCTSCTVTSQPADHPLPAQPSDFTGQLDHWGDTCGPCVPGEGKNVQLKIQNTTNHSIDLSPSAPVRVALICTTNMQPDGTLTAPLPAGGITAFVDQAIDASGNYLGVADTLTPGAQATSTQWGYAATDTGTATCEGAIVTTSDGTWHNETLSVTSRLTNISTFSFDVIAAPTTTAPPPTTTSTSTP
jgi:hypothetical protein